VAPTNDVARVAGSFRDPAGFVFERDGTLYRQVSRGFAATYDAVVASGLYDELIGAGLLVAHEEVDPGLGDGDAHRVLRPDRVPVLSFPYEWCPGQLRDAALLTLDIQKRALARGMTLRDASAYNVQFVRGRPVFIDTLSFEPWEAGRPWVAYGQFCEQFLAPLALQTEVDVRLRRLLVADVTGVPLDLAASLLPGRTKLKPGLLAHVHAHAKARRKGQADPDQPTKQARFSVNAMTGLVDSLRRTVAALEWQPAGTVWADYYDEAAHYSDATMAAKRGAVAATVADLRPATVWDLGANTGRFARIAADAGATTVAWDIDAGAVERAWREVRDQPPVDGDLLPLVQDLTNPSPGLGWAHAERPALADRGPVDLVLALALVHHLAIGSNVPLPDVIGELTRLGRHVLVEWVPKSDEKVRVLLATREDVFTHYTDEGFEVAIAVHADIVRREPLPGSDRVLYLLRSRTG
jgi:SAM-dependent methyltransferase